MHHSFQLIWLVFPFLPPQRAWNSASVLNGAVRGGPGLTPRRRTPLLTLSPLCVILAAGPLLLSPMKLKRLILCLVPKRLPASWATAEPFQFLHSMWSREFSSSYRASDVSTFPYRASLAYLERGWDVHFSSCVEGFCSLTISLGMFASSGEDVFACIQSGCAQRACVSVFSIMCM